MTQKVKCPYCDFRNTKPKVVNHIDKEHKDMLSKDYTASRSLFNYLNKKAFKNFKPDTKKTIDLIKLRLSEGYTEEDFYKVIDKMTNCWLSNGDLDKYLRPITLFGDNFDVI